MQMDCEWPLKATLGHHYFSGFLAGHTILLVTTMISVQVSMVLTLLLIRKGTFPHGSSWFYRTL